MPVYDGLEVGGHACGFTCYSATATGCDIALDTEAAEERGGQIHDIVFVEDKVGLLTFLYNMLQSDAGVRVIFFFIS